MNFDRAEAGFVDAGGWIALAVPSDSLHARAVAAFSRLLQNNSRLVTTEPVLFETFDALSDARVRHLAPVLRTSLLKLHALEVVAVDETARENALTFHQSRPDKEWSLTDCFSFVLMRQRDISQAIAFDHHFEQAGFRALLREPQPF